MRDCFDPRAVYGAAPRLYICGGRLPERPRGDPAAPRHRQQQQGGRPGAEAEGAGRSH